MSEKTKKSEYGMMACRECGQPVKVMINAHRGFSYSCLAKGCDDRDYAQADTLKHASWDKKITKFDDAPAAAIDKTDSAGSTEPEAPAPVAKPKLDMWGNPL